MQQAPAATSHVDPVAQAAIRSATWGFRISAAFLAVGLIISLARQQALEQHLGSFGTILDDAIHGHAAGFIGLAIAAIILTPVATTLTIAISFFREGDRRYGGFTLVVLAILVFSVAISQV